MFFPNHVEPHTGTWIETNKQGNFEKGVDFNLHKQVEVHREGNRAVKRPFTAIFLTVDCFKAFCMIAGTEKGKEVRKYYLELEKQFFISRSEKLKSIESRNLASGEWRRQGVSTPREYGGLTKAEYQELFGNSTIKKTDMDRSQILKLTAFESVEAWKLSENPENSLGFCGCRASITETAGLLEAVRNQNRLRSAAQA